MGLFSIFDSGDEEANALKAAGQAALSGDVAAGAGANAQLTNAGGAAQQQYADLGTLAGTRYGQAAGTATGMVQNGVAQGALPLQTAANGYSPLIDLGRNGSTMYANSLGLNGSAGNDAATAAFRASPGYAYRVGQATDQVVRGAAAAGMAASGNTLAAISDRAGNMADQGYNDWRASLGQFPSYALSATNGQTAPLTSLASLYANGGQAAANTYGALTGAGINANTAATGTGIGANLGAIGQGANLAYQGSVAGQSANLNAVNAAEADQLKGTEDVWNLLGNIGKTAASVATSPKPGG